MKNQSIVLKQCTYDIAKEYYKTVKRNSQKYKFTYYKKHQLPKEYKVEGYIDFGKYPEVGDDFTFVGLSHKGVTESFKVLNKKKKFKRIKGFIHVGDNHFLGIHSSLLIPLLFPLLFLFSGLLILSLFIMFEPKETDATVSGNNSWPIGGDAGTDIDLDTNTAEIVYNTYSGYQEINITEGMNVPFINKEENTYYAQFIVRSKNGDVLYTSDLITPGTHMSWDAYAHYHGIPGEYLHDLYVQFYKPILDENKKIIDFESTMVSACTPDFKVIIK